MRKILCAFLLGTLLVMGLTSCASGSRTNRDYTVNRAHKKVRPSQRATVRTTPSRKRSSASDDKSLSSRSLAKAELAERQKIVQFAQSFKGLSYRYGGKTPESGFDCSGLVYYTFRHFNYGMVAGSANQAKLGKRISIYESNPGDLLFFGNAQRVSHVGIVSSVNKDAIKMVHSSSSRGVVEDEILNSTYWKTRFLYARNVISGMDSTGKVKK